MNKRDFSSDDYCDLYAKKICDNCGKCLELEGVDTKAINIEDISKTVEENQYLEEQLKEAKELLEAEESREDLYQPSVKELDQMSDEEIDAIEDYGVDFKNWDLDILGEDDYVDALDNAVSLDEIGLEDDTTIEDLTEEIYPGVRKLKNK